MKILSVNVGQEQAIRGKSGTSGIFKYPTTDPVSVHAGGLTGDVIVDQENHGGVDQAVYIYTLPDYAWWSRSLGGRELNHGLFGENITLSDLESASLCIGDRLHMNDVILEVTAPRIPCVTLATRMDDPQFVKKFVQGRRYGAYCRVIQMGTIQVDQTVELEPYEGARIGINELADAFYQAKPDQSQLERFLSVPVAIRARQDYEQELRKLRQ